MESGTVGTDLLRLREVARRLDVCEETARRLVARGELPAVRLGAGPRAPIRVASDELQAWLDAPLPASPDEQAR